MKRISNKKLLERMNLRTRRLQKPQPPKYDNNAKRKHINNGWERYQIAFDKWVRKMTERGYDVSDEQPEQR